MIKHAIELLHEQVTSHPAVESSGSVLINTIARRHDRGERHTIIGAEGFRVSWKMIDVLAVIVATAVAVGVPVIMAFYQVVNLVGSIGRRALGGSRCRGCSEISISSVVRAVELATSGPDDIEWITRARSEYGDISAGREVNAIAVDLIIIWLASCRFYIAKGPIEVAL